MGRAGPPDGLGPACSDPAADVQACSVSSEPPTPSPADVLSVQTCRHVAQPMPSPVPKILNPFPHQHWGSRYTPPSEQRNGHNPWHWFLVSSPCGGGALQPSPLQPRLPSGASLSVPSFPGLGHPSFPHCGENQQVSSPAPPSALSPHCARPNSPPPCNVVVLSE